MRYRCLLVDDSELFVRAARSLLQREGLDVVATASTAAEAVAAAAAHPVDVSLIDIQLGPDDGTVLADELVRRRLGGRVLLVSALDRDDVADLVAASSADGFVPKDQLGRAAIERALGA